MRRLLTVVASLAMEHGLLGAWAPGAVAQGLNSCGSWALEHTGLGALQHVESSQTGDQTCVPALAAGVLTTGPPEKS